VLRDLGSTNGTYVNGTLVAEQALRDGSVLTVGSTNLTFRSR
jgi:pSer/pThr/pTyr-binding forkhead associated (FHA) protein